MDFSNLFFAVIVFPLACLGAYFLVWELIGAIVKWQESKLWIKDEEE